jgi:hypothetical protein
VNPIAVRAFRKAANLWQLLQIVVTPDMNASLNRFSGSLTGYHDRAPDVGSIGRGRFRRIVSLRRHIGSELHSDRLVTAPHDPAPSAQVA